MVLLPLLMPLKLANLNLDSDIRCGITTRVDRQASRSTRVCLSGVPKENLFIYLFDQKGIYLAFV
jgi:hypothetical protein